MATKYHDNYKADYTMGEKLYENYQKQRQAIMDAANMANRLVISGIDEHLFNYYAVLRTYFAEISAYMVNEKDNFTPDQIRSYGIKSDETPNKDGTISAYENEFLYAMFRKFIDDYYYWKNKENIEHKKIVPFNLLDLLTKIHVRLSYDSQWKISMGINLSKQLSETEKLKKAILGFNA